MNNKFRSTNILFLIFLVLIPCSLFSQTTLDRDFITNQHKWMFDNIAGYFISLFENRIAICIYIPPQGGPTGTNLSGGYYIVTGCHLDVGFKSKP